MTEKLKPCPFCGGVAEMQITKHCPSGYDYTPRCLNTSCCGRLTKKYTSKETAISFWNRRADNDDKDKLIELIKKAEKEFSLSNRPVLDIEEYVADYLLANGVILPPCKVGQKVYDISEFVLGVVAPEIYELKADEMTIEKGADGALNFVYDGMYINNEDIGEKLFFTEKEAEKALEGMKNG